MSIKITGLDEMQRKLETMRRKAAALDGKRSVPMKELLTPSFLAECSSFTSMDDMFATSGFKIESPEDFAAVPDDEWDQFVRANTTYGNWKDMLHAAAAMWTKQQLGF